MSLVIDASVACKWFFREEQHEEADRLFAEESLLAPDLIFYELGNVVWKRCRAGKLSVEDGESILKEIASAPIQVADVRVLMEPALQIASRYDRTFYDSSYLALAIVRDTVLVTADERFVNGLANTSLAGRVRLLVNEPKNFLPDALAT